MVTRNEARKQAFEAEILPHLDSAYRLARILIGHEQDAQDLVQDACLRAFKGFDGFERGSNGRAWLLTIVRRTCLNERRRRMLRPLLIPLSRAAEPGTIAEPADRDEAGTEEQALRRIERQHFLGALARLPEVYRTTLALVDLVGMRYAEAAAVLGCPSGTIMSRLFRGRRLLAQQLQLERSSSAQANPRPPSSIGHGAIPPGIAHRV